MREDNFVTLVLLAVVSLIHRLGFLTLKPDIRTEYIIH